MKTLKKEMTNAPSPLPDWVGNTPEAKTTYILAIENREACDFDQRIFLDRTEYEELKRHLAEVRGLWEVAAPDRKITALLNSLPSLRAFFRRVEAVLSGDDGNSDLRALTEALRVCEENRGSATPAESFVYKLLSGRPLTPEDVENYCAEFRTEFELMAEESRNFVARYPNVCATGHKG